MRYVQGGSFSNYSGNERRSGTNYDSFALRGRSAAFLVQFDSYNSPSLSDSKNVLRVAGRVKNVILQVVTSGNVVLLHRQLNVVPSIVVIPLDVCLILDVQGWSRQIGGVGDFSLAEVKVWRPESVSTVFTEYPILFEV